MTPARLRWAAGILAMLLAALAPALGLAAEYTGVVRAVDGDTVVIRLNRPVAPPPGSTAQVFSPQSPQTPICRGTVTNGAGILIAVLIKGCSEPVKPGYPARIQTIAPAPVPLLEPAVDKCQGLAGFLECHLRYTLYRQSGRIRVRSSGNIPFTTTDQSPEPIRGQGVIRQLSNGNPEAAKFLGPRDVTYEIRGVCQGDKVTFTITSLRMGAGPVKAPDPSGKPSLVPARPGGEPAGAPDMVPSRRGGAGPRRVTLHLVNGATATVPISEGGGSGQATYVLHLNHKSATPGPAAGRPRP